MKKLSVIVPVYNVEDYLDECLESIICQIDEECEIILVDDGSTDRSGAICDGWALKHDIIKVVHKDNGGLSSARNAGLTVANGEYILFIDSDDRIAPNCIKALRLRIDETNADLYFLSAIKFFPNGSTEALDDPIDRDSIKGKSDIDVVKYISSMTRFPGSACTKAYKKSFLVENDIHFPYDKRIAEDLGFTLKCFLEASCFDVVECNFYEYRQNRMGSITSNSTSFNKSFWNQALFLEESIELLADNKQPRSPKSMYALGIVAYEYYAALVNLCHVTERKNEAYTMMRSTKWICRYSNSKRGRLISLLLSCFGVKITSRCLSFLYWRRKRNKG